MVRTEQVRAMAAALGLFFESNQSLITIERQIKLPTDGVYVLEPETFGEIYNLLRPVAEALRPKTTHK